MTSKLFPESDARSAADLAENWMSSVGSYDAVGTLLIELKRTLTGSELKLLILACREIIHFDGVVKAEEREFYGRIRRVLWPAEFLDLFPWERCHNCRSRTCECLSESEIDRWTARKNVYERNAKGKYSTRNVPVKKIKVQYSWKCLDCEHEWVVEATKELN